MYGLFIALGIAILTLLTILLWFLPHLLQQQALRTAQEYATLRELISEIITEQETVSMRQMKLGTSVSQLQKQVEQVTALSTKHMRHDPYITALLESDTLQALESRLSGLQTELAQHQRAYTERSQKDTESWMRLMELLSTMQDRIRTISDEQLVVTGARKHHSPNGHRYEELTG